MKLALRQTQRVVMTPLLQQAIQLLQLSTLELEEVVRKELEENPLLEEVPVETAETAEAPAGTTTPESVEAPPAEPTTEPPSKESATVDAEKADELPFDIPQALFDDHGDERTPVSMEERDDLPFENLGRHRHLAGRPSRGAAPARHRRCRAVRASARRSSATWTRTATSGPSAPRSPSGTGAAVEVVEQVLALVQGFDPTGVAARSVQECLLLQLTADAEPDPVSVEILEKHFEDLEPAPLPRDRAGDEAAARPHHGVGRGDPGARAEAWAPVRRQ